MIILIGVFLFFILSLVMVGMVIRLSNGLNQRLNQMNRALEEAGRSIGQNLTSATGVFGSVKEQLGRLQATNSQILEVSRNITSLQELLRAPKFRGQMGETMLENLLAQVLPAGSFKMQHRFSGGDIVDAVITLGERLVPVDAKFSLENFQKMLEAADDESRAALRKRFIQDVRARIDEISAKYILPGENTYDFALMYVPAENVYYEVIIKEDLFSYCVSKKVIPVSPNTFYAYLQVICLGLKGLKIEENAKVILKNLGALSAEISRFGDDFKTLGGHLNSAGSKYSEAQRRLERFTEKLNTIQESRRLEHK